MKYNPNKHHRRSIRLKGYDYSKAGLYFITMCCKNRACLFGKIVDKKMVLNDTGVIVQQCWEDIPNHFPNVVLHEFVVMPNHIHGIIRIVGANHHSPDNNSQNHSPDNNSQHSPNNHSQYVSSDNHSLVNGAKNVSPLRTPTIGSVVRGFKIGVTKWMRQNTNIHMVWQRNYWEHIIRDRNSYVKISKYIVNNPAKWNDDSLKL
jgi:putative transposase